MLLFHQPLLSVVTRWILCWFKLNFALFYCSLWNYYITFSFNWLCCIYSKWLLFLKTGLLADSILFDQLSSTTMYFVKHCVQTLWWTNDRVLKNKIEVSHYKSNITFFHHINLCFKLLYEFYLIKLCCTKIENCYSKVDYSVGKCLTSLKLRELETWIDMPQKVQQINKSSLFIIG